VLQAQRATATRAARTPGTGQSRLRSAPTVAGWAVGLSTTAAILGTPYLLFAYHSPQLHLVLDSVDACAAVLLSYLVYGRFLRSRRLQDLLLAEGLAVLAVAGLVLSLLLELAAYRLPEQLGVWLPVLLRTVGAVLVVAGALTPDRVLTGAWRRRVHLGTWALVGAAVAALCLAGDHLPQALAQSPPDSAQHPVITGHPALIAAQGVGASCFLLASLAFTWRSRARSNELLRWLGPGCALVGFARLSYALFPSLYSGWLYTGDVLRTTGYLVLLLGAAREIRQYWSAQSRAAVLEDRRRLARELHDGLVQELGYLRMGAVSLPDDEVRRDLLATCDRALDEARAAVDALGRSTDEPLGFVLPRAARQVAERYRARVDVDLDDSVSSDPELRHALVRITREAVSNAIRHGHPARISVRLSREGDRCRLVVEDDGRGFDPAAVTREGTGYGLTSMADRARVLGGSFSIDSRPGRGTQVLVTW
jgi:signal transduction histidine kinase